jgi:hypothetical protein
VDALRVDYLSDATRVDLGDKGCDSVEDVRVDGTGVTGKGAATLQRAIPNAKIIY